MQTPAVQTEVLTKYQKYVLVAFVLVFALLFRIYDFGALPSGLNQDEASIGYDAWALLHYGIDRNGSTLPVHLLAWGSGQNVLYAYFSMPFIALFGLNVVSVRLVNLIFAMVSVAVVFFMTQRYKGYKVAIIAASLVAIAPWHIMLSRWGLESNLFPAMMLLSIWLFLKAFDRACFLIVSAGCFALSLYAYGSAYFVVTIFCLCGMVYLLKKQVVPLKIMMISLCAFLLIALPIYLFVIVNVFDLQTIKIGALTIPHTYGSRISTLSGFSVNGFFKNIYSNLFLQTDGSIRNSLPVLGCFYIISLPFCIIGMVRSFREKSPFDVALLLWLVCSFGLFFIYSDTNINRVNSIYLPLILYTAIGIADVIKNRCTFLSISLAYIMMFSGFLYTYFGSDYRKNIATEFFYSFDQAIEKAEEISGSDTIYVTDTVNMPYIYVLFYTETPPQEYLETVRIPNPNQQFQQVDSFGRYVFDVSSAYTNTPGIYILKNTQIDEAVQSRENPFDEIYSFENYSVVVSK